MKMNNSLFLHLCWFINSIRLYSLSAFLRWVVLHIARRVAIMETYDNPEKVGGYRGWLEVPGFGPLAFVRTDGTYQYKW